MKKLLSILTIIITIFISCSCSNSSDEQFNIPTLTITANGEIIPIEYGCYKWTENNQGIVVDTASPDEIAKDMAGSKLPPKGTLNLKFTKKPNKISVISWGKSKDENYTVTKNTITLPEKEGTYIFEIFGEWKEGNVSYITKVIVKD